MCELLLKIKSKLIYQTELYQNDTNIQMTKETDGHTYPITPLCSDTRWDTVLESGRVIRR